MNLSRERHVGEVIKMCPCCPCRKVKQGSKQGNFKVHEIYHEICYTILTLRTLSSFQTVAVFSDALCSQHTVTS